MAAAPLDRVKALLAALPEDDQRELRRYLSDILVTPDEAEAIQLASLEVRSKGAAKAIRYTYRQESVRCGKAGCWCKQGSVGHGPYTYKYWKDPETGKLLKEYLGKTGSPTRPAKRQRAAPARGGIGESSSGPSSLA